MTDKLKPGTKLKDLEDDISLENLKVKTSEGKIGYWKSQWTCGVWLSDGKTNRIYPQFVQQLTDCLEWEIANENEPINL